MIIPSWLLLLFVFCQICVRLNMMYRSSLTLLCLFQLLSYVVYSSIVLVSIHYQGNRTVIL